VIRTQHGHRVVIVSGIVLAQFAVGDRMAEAHAMVSLVEQGWADQNDVARAFARSARTLDATNVALRAAGWPLWGARAAIPRVDAGEVRTPPVGRALKGEGGRRTVEPHDCPAAGGERENDADAPPSARLESGDGRAGDAAVAARTCGPKTVRLSPGAAATGAGEAGAAGPVRAGTCLRLGSPADDDLPVSFDTDPADRRLDSLLAYLGLPDDAAPLFRAGARTPRAGVLLASRP
jgi:hypothetical protein